MEQQRKSYQEKAHKSLDDLFNGLDSLESKLRDASNNFSQGMEKNIAEMKVEGDNLKRKFKEMCDANNDSWEDIKTGFEQAATSLRDAFSKAWKRFNGE